MVDSIRSARSLLLVLTLCSPFLVAVGSVAPAAASARSGPAVARGPAAPVTPGEELWAARYNGSSNDTDEARALGVSPDGARVFVTGGSTGATGCCEDYATVAYNTTTGTRLWVASYNGPGNDHDEATALGVSPDGSKVFVTGLSNGTTGFAAFATLAYDTSTGAKLWVGRYKGPGIASFAKALGVSPDGSKVFVTGQGYGSDGHTNYATLAYDASTGARLWVARYKGQVTFAPDNAATALGVSPGGTTVFVTGYSTGSGGQLDYATIAYDSSTGAKLWVARYEYKGSGNRDDSATALGLSPDGTMLFVTGTSSRTSNCCEINDYATVAYDASTGARLWVARLNGPVGGGDAVAYALGVSPDGSRVFVTGRKSNYAATVAYGASTGAKLWVARYKGPGGAAASSLRVSADGTKVFIAGNRYVSSGDDYVTVAHNASTGTKLWVTRYNGPGHDYDAANAIGVSPDGARVFVTGTSDRFIGCCNGYDYATVAYSVA